MKWVDIVDASLDGPNTTTLIPSLSTAKASRAPTLSYFLVNVTGGLCN